MTPVRRQYLKIKNAYPDALVLFRLGDFYETFDDDAHLASRELEITLTSRSLGKNLRIPMAGVPAHSLESYLARLIKKGHKVAICEQLTDPAASKGLVERDVVRVVTPGTVLESSLLDQNANNYLAAVVEDGPSVGLAYVDITTGEFAATQLDLERLLPELQRIAPAEILIPAGDALPGWVGAGNAANSSYVDPDNDGSNPSGYPLTNLNPATFDLDLAGDALLSHYEIRSLEAFGCENLPWRCGLPGPSWTIWVRPTRPLNPGWHRLMFTSPAPTWSWMPRPGATWNCFRPDGGRANSFPCWPLWMLPEPPWAAGSCAGG